MSQCEARSLPPLPAAYFAGSGEVLAGTPALMATDVETGAHRCTRVSGHEGPHTKETLEWLGSHENGNDVAIRYRYVWSDEHTLQCSVDCVFVERVALPPLKVLDPQPNVDVEAQHQP